MEDIKSEMYDGLESKLDQLVKKINKYTSIKDHWQSVKTLYVSIEKVFSAVGETYVQANIILKGSGPSNVEDRLDEMHDTIKQLLKLEDDVKAISGLETAFKDQMNDVTEALKTSFPGFDVFKLMLEGYNLSQLLKTAEKEINGLPTTCKKLCKVINEVTERGWNWSEDYTLFDFGITVPIASIGWISAIFTVGCRGEIHIEAGFKAKLFPFTESDESKVVKVNAEGKALLSVTGYLGIGVDLLGLVQAEIAAELKFETGVDNVALESMIYQSTSYSGKGDIAFSAESTAVVRVEAALLFRVTLNFFIRRIVSIVTEGKLELMAEFVLGTTIVYESSRSIAFEDSLSYDSTNSTLLKFFLAFLPVRVDSLGVLN